MGKKGKGNNLNNMSEEERARFLQMKAEMEEEARRRKMQLISIYLKSKLKHEDGFCRLNMAKINQEWRSILRRVKCQEMRKEIINIQKNCQDMMNHKDNVIKRLFNDLEIAHNQHDTMSQAHMEMLQHFSNIQQQRVEFFYKNYEREKQGMLQEFQHDFERLKDLTTKSREFLEYVYSQLEDNNENQKNKAEERFLDNLDDIKAEMHIRIEKITEKGEKELEKLWHEYQRALAEYVAHTEGFYADYMDLKERDEEYMSQMRDYTYEIEKASNQIATLKLNLAEVEEKGEVQIKSLKLTKEHLTRKLHEVKQQVNKEMQDNNEKFKLISVESYKAVKFLKSLFDKGNTILQLAGVCRKFETEKEKILPLGLPPVTQIMFGNEEEQLELISKELEKDDICNWFLMENFWKRVNNVKIDVVCLTQRKQALQKENERLKAELQERLISLNISNGTNSHVNDYLAKRPSSMRVQNVQRIDMDARKLCQSANVALSSRRTLRPFSCVTEANLTNAVRSQMLAKSRPKLASIVAIKH